MNALAYAILTTVRPFHSGCQNYNIQVGSEARACNARSWRPTPLDVHAQGNLQFKLEVSASSR